MNYKILMMIEDGRRDAIDVSAFSKESANIYIYAESWQQAQELLTKGQDLATEACRNWKPEEAQKEEEPAKKQKHYISYTRSIEEMQEAAQAYEERPEGQRFTKCLKTAIEFTSKHSNRGLSVSQLNYLMNKHHNSLLNGCYDLTALAYRRGYMNGHAAARTEERKRKKC